MNTYYQNGRVVNVAENVTKRPMMWKNLDDSPVENNFQYRSMIGIFEPTTLNTMFFSKDNLDIIQNMIRYGVWKKSGEKYVIDRQSDAEIQIIMRSIFLQHSPNLEDNVKQQIAYLDKMVADWCVPKVLAEVQQYVGYLNDIEKMPMPIDRPVNLSSKGTKISRSITSTF
jgi:hypothetical protein